MLTLQDPKIAGSASHTTQCY